MKVKSNLVKFTAAAALTITGIGAVNCANTNTSATNVEAATKKLKINYVPGYSINVWDSYKNPSFTGKRLQHGKTVTVYNKALDKKGKIWYRIGAGQWIPARYTSKPGANINLSIRTPKKRRARKAARVVKLAKAEVGKSYVKGGNGPSGFDCSGLAQYVYSKAAGMELSRSTYSQVKQGKKVSMQNLKPGDLLFWGSSSAPYHVGIYVGNNQYVHAATPAQGVVKDSLSSYFYPSVAKRVLD